MCKQFNRSLALVVFKLYVQAILDTDFHLNWTVGVRVARQGVHGNVHLADDVTQTAHDRYPQEVPTDHRKDNRFSTPKFNTFSNPTSDGHWIQRTPRRVSLRWQIQTGTMCSE